MVSVRKISFLILLNVFLLALLFVFIEGLSSIVLAILNFSTLPPLAESFHTEYDAELGWVNKPNVYMPDMYGAGVYLRTNSQLFRNNEDFSREVPEGKVRIVCSGDSFTLGYGVDNDHTWVQVLADQDERIETVNMGQGGYGIDQAYLWYKRDEHVLEHDVLVFAFINNDFLRMQVDIFGGYNKPYLNLEDGKLIVENVPVPRPLFDVHKVNRYMKPVKQLALMNLIKRWFPPKMKSPPLNDQGLLRQVVLKVFEDLAALDRSRNRELVLVYLPTEVDYMGKTSDPWRNLIRSQASVKGYHFVDLIEDFRKLRPEEIKKFFIPPNDIVYPAAAGHYTVEGNAYVGRLLYGKLMEIPAISSRFVYNR